MNKPLFVPLFGLAICCYAAAQSAPGVPSTGTVGTGNSGAVTTMPPNTTPAHPPTGGAIVKQNPSNGGTATTTETRPMTTQTGRNGLPLSGTNKLHQEGTAPRPMHDATGNQIPQPAPLSDPSGNQRREDAIDLRP